LLTPLNALFDEEGRLAEVLDLFWKVLVEVAERFPVCDPPDQLPVVVPVEGRVPAVPVAGRVPTAPVEGCAPTFPVEGRVPTAPVEGRVPTLPADGREPIAPVEAWAPPELQPRASLVLAEAVPAPLVRIRFWSGCHFCALLTFTLRELLMLTFLL
jgi:hypothetical protein